MAQRSERNLTSKDWITIGFSISALLISAATTYFNIIKQTDDIRAVFGNDTPFFGVPFGKEQLFIKADHRITFINSGNRQAAIVGASLEISQPEGPSKNCDQNVIRSLDYDLDPFVIKPNEISVRRLKLSEKQSGGYPPPKDGITSNYRSTDGSACISSLA